MTKEKTSIQKKEKTTNCIKNTINENSIVFLKINLQNTTLMTLDLTNLVENSIYFLHLLHSKDLKLEFLSLNNCN